MVKWVLGKWSTSSAEVLPNLCEFYYRLRLVYYILFQVSCHTGDSSAFPVGLEPLQMNDQPRPFDPVCWEEAFIGRRRRRESESHSSTFTAADNIWSLSRWSVHKERGKEREKWKRRWESCSVDSTILLGLYHSMSHTLKFYQSLS